MRSGETVAHPCNMTTLNILFWNDKYKQNTQCLDEFKQVERKLYVTQNNYLLQHEKSGG